jgi:hypothetical protein
MPHGIYGRLLPALALASAAHVTGTANGVSVDLTQFSNNFESALFVLNIGTVTDGTHVPKLQDSPDGTTWTDVDTSRVQGGPISIGTAQSGSVAALGYLGGGPAHYVRLVLTTSGATTGGVIGAVAVLGEGSDDPVLRS